jgi:putative nucleotidyltransferase with HDIG domain
VAGENAALKAGVQLLLRDPADSEARRTVEDQLLDLCERMGFDLLMVSGPSASGAAAAPLAAVLRRGGRVEPLDTAAAKAAPNGLSLLDGQVYQVASVPIDQEDGNIGWLSVGEVFDLAEFTTRAVLLHNGRALESNLDGIGLGEAESALRHCPAAGECDVRLRGVNYVSPPIESDLLRDLGDGYALRSLQNVDAAAAPVRHVLERVFGSVALGALLVAVAVSLASARSIVRPIAKVVERLKEAEGTGELAEFHPGISRVREIQGLAESFNRAAAAIREGRENLNHAYVEFIESLANALDARDRYTAGHSNRVSELSSSVAREMGLPAETVELVRVGALLHDIGKIGIADAVLQKPDRLTPAEFAIIRMHPEIGRRILEGVDGFAPYLPAVELHHENWDGTGYPRGQSGETTPVEARIIHVTDAFDAMTSDRPYRRGMEEAQALAILRKCARTQFDPYIVDVFVNMFAGCKSESGIAEMAATEAA